MKNIILKIGLLFIGLIFSLTIDAQNEIIVPFSNPSGEKQLDVYIKDGSINVKGTDRKDVLIKYRNDNSEQKDKDHKDEEKELKGLKRIRSSNVRMEITEENNVVSILRSDIGNSIIVDIEVPKNINVNLENYLNGDVIVKDVNGDHTLASYTSSINASNIKGTVSASTYAGSIDISFSEITSDSDMSFSNFADDISISLPSSFNSNFKLKTNSGEILSDLDLVMIDNEPKIQQNTSDGVYKVFLDTWTFVKLNGGGPEITIKSEFGDIYIRGNK